MLRNAIVTSLFGALLLSTGCGSSAGDDSDHSEGALEEERPTADVQNVDIEIVAAADATIRAYVEEHLPELRLERDQKLVVEFSEGLDVTYMRNEHPVTARNAKGERLVFFMGTIMKGEDNVTPEDLQYGSIGNVGPEDWRDIGGLGFWAVLKQAGERWELYTVEGKGTLFQPNHDWRELCSIAEVPRVIIPARSPARTRPARAAGPTCP